MCVPTDSVGLVDRADDEVVRTDDVPDSADEVDENAVDHPRERSREGGRRDGRIRWRCGAPDRELSRGIEGTGTEGGGGGACRGIEGRDTSTAGKGSTSDSVSCSEGSGEGEEDEAGSGEGDEYDEEEEKYEASASFPLPNLLEATSFSSSRKFSGLFASASSESLFLLGA